jgi:hypothetical protein
VRLERLRDVAVLARRPSSEQRISLYGALADDVELALEGQVVGDVARRGR